MPHVTLTGSNSGTWTPEQTSSAKECIRDAMASVREAAIEDRQVRPAMPVEPIPADNIYTPSMHVQFSRKKPEWETRTTDTLDETVRRGAEQAYMACTLFGTGHIDEIQYTWSDGIQSGEGRYPARA